MAFLANQNQIFRDSTHFLHKIHAELPKARIRNFDILSAVDVLTTGSYQRMPTKFQVQYNLYDYYWKKGKIKKKTRDREKEGILFLTWFSYVEYTYTINRQRCTGYL